MASADRPDLAAPVWCPFREIGGAPAIWGDPSLLSDVRFDRWESRALTTSHGLAGGWAGAETHEGEPAAPSC